ncbi:MAG: hypothetical protein ACOC2O_01035 [Bacillota bacterium]
MSTVIGVFDDQSSAEKAVEEIQQVGVSKDNISVIARQDTVQDGGDQGSAQGMQSGARQDQGLQGQKDQGQNITDGAATGGTLGGLAGLLAGAGALTIPGVGPIIAAGPIAAGLTGAAAGGLGGSLVDLGIDQERGQYYEQEVQKGGILATVEVKGDDIQDVTSTFRKNGARDVESH